MTELKSCPFCGGKAAPPNPYGLIRCGSGVKPHCPASHGCVSPETWNSRVVPSGGEAVAEPTGYLFELRYGPEHWSGRMFAERLPKDGDYRNVTPLYASAPACSQPQTEWFRIDDPDHPPPKDGTRLRVKYDNEEETVEDGVFWSDERWCMIGPPQGSRGPGWCSTEAGGLPVDPPTHWMPLPVPPISKGSAT